MRFSLVLATFGPAIHLSRCLDSLAAQSFKEFEVILVDQNDRPLDDLVAHYRQRLNLIHLRCRPGLSRARNRGLAQARGDILGFPDDDCWYQPDLLTELHARFLAHPDIVGFTGRCTDGRGQLAAGGDGRRAGPVSVGNVWHRAVSATMFLRRRAFIQAGVFDEHLGLGSGTIFRSGEETDLILRILEHGHKVYYDPSLEVFHPLPPPPDAPGAVFRAWSYGLGMGRVLGKHGRGPLTIAYHAAYPLVGAVVAILTGRLALAHMRFARALGRYVGWCWTPDHPMVETPLWVRSRSPQR